MDFCTSSSGVVWERFPGQREDNIRCLTMLGHFGFECLPHQLVNRSIQQGFSFNILCVGIYLLSPWTKFYQPIVDYIDAQFEAYLQEELKIKRSFNDYHDSRIHVCLYFISPTGHSLKSLDLLTMKNIDSKVNIIPLIAKADTISKNDLQKFKCKIMSELVSNGIQIYQFPTDDETTAQVNSSMNNSNKGHLPFAVVGSTDEVKVGKRMVRGRQYPWGVLQVENENHSDFVKLRDILLNTNMEDLKEQTHTWHYEHYRCCKLQKMGFTDVGPDNQPVRCEDVISGGNEKPLIHHTLTTPAFTIILLAILQDKFEHLKRVQQEETMKLEEERRQLEEEIIDFYKMKAASETLQTQACTNIKKDKDQLLCFDVRLCKTNIRIKPSEVRENQRTVGNHEEHLDDNIMPILDPFL
ncbi:hypothetical protein HPG69_005150, partial [Diceros bicornis minor]